MNKIIGLICLGGIGLMYGLVLTLAWLMSIIYLLISEIIGTKKFIRKFKNLNKMMIEEFQETIKSFKNIFEIV